jgi:hypothetical protein
MSGIIFYPLRHGERSLPPGRPSESRPFSVPANLFGLADIRVICHGDNLE